MGQFYNGGGCGCSDSSQGASNEPMVPGLQPYMLEAFKMTQGEVLDKQICFIDFTKPVAAIASQANGGNGILTFVSDDHCFAVGDDVRMINYDKCTPDTSATGTVFPIAAIAPNPTNPAYDDVTFTGLVVEDQDYETASTADGTYSLPGCPSDVVEEDSLPPYAVKSCPADVLISAYAWANEDTFAQFNATASPGDRHFLTRVLGQAKVGDKVTSAALGLENATVTKVYRQTLLDSEQRNVSVDRIEVDQTITSGSTCAAVTVERGLLFRANVKRVGNCLSIKVKGSATKQLQLSGSKVGEYYNMGTMAIMMHYGVLDDAGKLEMRTRELGRAPLHIAPGANFA